MWNRVEESSVEEETLGNSFLTNGLFKISNEEQSSKNPRISAALQNKKVLIAVDKSLISLEDESIVDCRFFSFEAEIDCFAVSRSGDLTVCCLSDGNIFGVHIKGIAVLNFKIQDEDIGFNQTFLDVIQVNDEYNIMCTNGKVYKLHNIDEPLITAMIGSQNLENTVELNESLVKSAVLEKIANTRISSKIDAFCFVETYDGGLFIVSGSDGIHFITANHVVRIAYSSNISRLKKIFNLDNFILGLSVSGELVEICPYAKIMRKMRLNMEMLSIDDMHILESNEEYIELLVLSTGNDQGERAMKILDFPSMSCKSELTVPIVSWLVTQQKSSINMYFISGTTNANQFIQTIEFKSITETDPEDRYKKLLLRGHFDEAEKFAKQFDLSLEPLHEARVKKSLMIIQRVKPSSKEFEQYFDQLMVQLCVIEDKNFLVTLRLAEIPDRSSMMTFLKYLLENIETNQYQKETNEINELLLRLETLRLIDPDECNMQWSNFLYNKDMARVAMEYFKTDVLLSCLVWSRHSSSIIPNMNLDQFHKWLNVIPSTVTPFCLVQWLKHFAPCFLQLYPHEMTRMVDWSLQRTRALQFSNTWPEIGLEFINNINGIFKDIKFMFVDIRRSYHNNMEKIQKLIFTLEEMVVLKKTYHLTTTLDEYSQGSTEESAFRLLQRIQIQNFSRMVNDFLYPIFMERGLSPEPTISKYVQFLCTNKNLSYWQERAVLAIDLMHNEDNCLSSALLVLKVSPVPWSDKVLPLAKLGDTSNNPLARSIYIEYKTQAIKIIKVKYGWPVDYFDLQQDRVKLVFRILKVQNPDMIDDVKTLIKSSPDIAHEAYFHLIHRLVELKMIDEIVELVNVINEELDSNTQMFISVLRSFTQLIDEDELEDDEETENYMEGIKVVFGQLKKLLSEFDANSEEQRIRKLRNIIKFRRVFKIELKLASLQTDVERRRMLEEGVSYIAIRARQSSSIDDIWSKTDLLVATMGFDRFYTFKLLCQKLNNLYITCHIVDDLSSSIDLVEENEIENALELVVLMVSQQINYFENNISSSFHDYDPLTFPLAYELLSKCLAKYSLTNHSTILQLLQWIKVGRNYYPFDVIESTKNERIITNKIFGSHTVNGNESQNGNRRESFSVFDTLEERIVVAQHNFNENLIPVLRCVCNSLKMIIFETCTANILYTRFEDHLKNSKSNQQQNKDDFFGSLENLLKLKQHQPAFKIVQKIVEHQTEANTVIIPPQFVTTVNRKILKFLLSQKEPDYMDAFRILRSEQNCNECLEYLRGVLKNNSQKIAYSTFSEMYNKYIGNAGSVADERQNRLKFYYYSELCKYDQSLRFKTNFDSMDISDLLKDLENRLLSVELVKKLSKDFGWDYQKKLVDQIKILLQGQELEFEIKTDVFGKDEIFVKSTVETIRKKCDPYLHEITNMNLLATEMKAYLEVINYYFYEMYLVVLELIEYAKKLSTEHKIFRNVLFLLKHKLTGKRCPISTEEVEIWQKSQSDNGVLPSIAKYRMPFLPLMEMDLERFLREDLNADTYEKLIPLITLHASSFKNVKIRDQLEAYALTAAKNSVREMKAKFEASKGAQWQLKSTNNAFLQRILRMVTLVEDKTKRGMILYYVVNNTPEGSDQVEAAYEAWKFAREYEQELRSSKFADFVDRIYRKYPLVKTQHLLRLYGLTDDRLMQLVESPTELINALYHHESILQPQKKDINKLCFELAELCGIDLLSLQHKLLHKLLAFAGDSSTDESGDANETLYEDFIGNTPTEETNFISDESVVRAHYILSSWDNSIAMNFLASELTSNSSNTENQLQFYETFAKLVDDQSESYMELINPNDYLLVKCCHFLKQLGLNLKIEAFKEMDKVAILKKLWTSHHNNAKGLEVMSFICLGFNVHMPQIWNGILKKMVALKMISHLSILVEVLSTKSQLLHLDGLKQAWECVIKEPFLHATKARTYEQDARLLNAFIALQKCPISTFLDLESHFELCMRLERPHMAAIFMAFINEQKRGKFIKVLESVDKNGMKKEIVELEDMGIAPVVTKSVTNILRL